MLNEVKHLHALHWDSHRGSGAALNMTLKGKDTSLTKYLVIGAGLTAGGAGCCVGKPAIQPEGADDG